jgi:hypothetical protein
MQRLSSIAKTLGVVGSLAAAAGGCSNEKFAPNAAAAGSPGQDQDAGSDGGAGAGEIEVVLDPPVQLAVASSDLSGVTSDGWAVFRDGDALRAVTIGPDSATQKISANAGNVLIRGRVVFNWTNIDWTTNVGDLSVWTSTTGTQEIGPTLYTEGSVAASEEGTTIAFTANTLQDTTDLVIAPSDLSAPTVLIHSMGRCS